ncbi:unnamed protein product, partial [Prorocentrum cordatum]
MGARARRIAEWWKDSPSPEIPEDTGAQEAAPAPLPEQRRSEQRLPHPSGPSLAVPALLAEGELDDSWEAASGHAPARMPPLATPRQASVLDAGLEAWGSGEPPERATRHRAEPA